MPLCHYCFSVAVHVLYHLPAVLSFAQEEFDFFLHWIFEFLCLKWNCHNVLEEAFYFTGISARQLYLFPVKNGENAFDNKQQEPHKSKCRRRLHQVCSISVNIIQAKMVSFVRPWFSVNVNLFFVQFETYLHFRSKVADERRKTTCNAYVSSIFGYLVSTHHLCNQ